MIEPEHISRIIDQGRALVRAIEALDVIEQLTDAHKSRIDEIFS